MTKHSVPTYETDEEVHAAREMHGAAYDRLVERKAINGPTREEVPDAELRERIAKVSERKAAKGKGAKRSRSAKKPITMKAAKRPSRAKKAKTSNDAPASESASSE